MAEVPTSTDYSCLLTPDQTAHRLGISRSTLKRMRLRGDGPKPVKITPRTIRYEATEVDVWLDNRTAESAANRALQHG